MRIFHAVVALTLAAAFLGHLPSASVAAAPTRGLSATDRATGAWAARLAAAGLPRAARWAARQQTVRRVSSGAGNSGLDISFRDGARLLILPRTVTFQKFVVPHSRPLRVTGASAAGRAAVLLPFQNELNEGPDAAATEINTLKAAGFSVDVYRNTDVTVALMQHLTQYNVVYVETHSYVSADGSVAVVVTGDSNANSSGSFLKDGTVQQALVAGDPSRTLYLGINAGFVRKHMDNFLNSSILFLNGCDLLRAGDFWAALQSRNLATMVSWDHEVYSAINEFAADYMFPQLGNGASISAAIDATTKAGLGQSVVGNTTAHLGALGDGDNTLAKAAEQATPTPIPTATPVPTMVPTDTPVPTAKPAVKKCKKGYKRVKKHGKTTCVKVKKP